MAEEAKITVNNGQTFFLTLNCDANMAELPNLLLTQNLTIKFAYLMFIWGYRDYLDHMLAYLGNQSMRFTMTYGIGEQNLLKCPKSWLWSFNG